MDPLDTIIISGAVSFVTATASSLLVTKYRFSREEERRQSEKTESWEEELEKELYNSRQILIDILAAVGTNTLVDSSYNGSPDEYVHQQDSPKFEKLDGHINRIEELSGRTPDRHSNLGYYLTEISRQYRTGPTDDTDHRDRWAHMKKFVEDARDQMKQNKE